MVAKANVMNTHTASIVTIALAEKASLVMGGLVKVNKYLILVIFVVIGDELMTISPSFLHYLNFTYTSGNVSMKNEGDVGMSHHQKGRE